MKLKFRLSIVIYIFFLINTLNCNKNEIIDPFWDINLNWDKEIIIGRLTESSKFGKITNCVFSFEKVTYINNRDFNAKVTGSLNNPLFEKNALKKLSYSLIAEFKNEQVSQFNPGFYKFFKTKMETNYGGNYNETFKDDNIVLHWSLPDNKYVTVNVLKTINHYTIKITT